MSEKLLPCPFCDDPLTTKPYPGGLYYVDHVRNTDCPISSVSVEARKWNIRRAGQEHPAVPAAPECQGSWDYNGDYFRCHCGTRNRSGKCERPAPAPGMPEKYISADDIVALIKNRCDWIAYATAEHERAEEAATILSQYARRLNAAQSRADRLQAELDSARKDAERLDELQQLAVDTEWGSRKETVLIIRWDNTPVSASLRKTIDAARGGKHD